jgi:hypothetical protein
MKLTTIQSTTEHLRAILEEATKQRDQRRDPILIATGPEPGWLMFERETMLTEVNTIRADRDLPPVSLDMISRIDQYATGCDWFQKFTFYCAELTEFGNRWEQR